MRPFLSSDFRVVVEWCLSHHRIAIERLSHGDDTYSCIAIALALRSEPSPSQFLASALCSVFQSHDSGLPFYALETVYYRSIVTLIDISGSRPAFSGCCAEGRGTAQFSPALPLFWASFRFEPQSAKDLSQNRSSFHIRSSAGGIKT